MEGSGQRRGDHLDFKGWVTKITKDGDKYTKTAEKDGKAVGSPSDVEKVE